MAVVTLTFDHALNESLSIGDSLYMTPTDLVDSTEYKQAGQGAGAAEEFGVAANYILLGTVVGIDWENYMVNIDPEPFVNISPEDFIFFGKNAMAEVSSVIGYYAEAKFVNTSWTHNRKRGELFSVGVDVFESSK